MPTSELCRVVAKTIASEAEPSKKVGIILRHKRQVSIRFFEPRDGSLLSPLSQSE